MIESPKAARLTPATGRAALLVTALIWGSGFLFMKNSVDVLPVFLLLSIRFTGAALLLGLLCLRRLKGIGRGLIRHGLFCGLLMASAYAIQTFGLRETTAGKNAFLTAIYCVISPFVSRAWLKERTSGKNWLAAFLCLIGIGLVSLQGDLTVGRGDALTLISGVLYAVHLVALSHYGQRDDPVLLTLMQFVTTAVLCWIGFLCTERFPASVSGGTVLDLVYLSVVATTLALVLQNVGQSVTPAAQASILLCLESVFGVMFSCLFGGEQLSLRIAAGFIVIFAAVVISQLQFGLPERSRS